MRLYGQIVRQAEGGDSGGAPATEAAPVVTTAVADAPAPSATGLTDSLLDPKPAAETDPAKTEPAKEEPKAEPEAKVELKAEDYKLEKLDEIGLSADDPVLAAFLEGAAKGGMDNESVNAVVQALGPQIKERLDAPHKAWIEMNKSWADEVRADAKLGGANFDATVSRINAGIDMAAGSPEAARACREAMLLTGAGNNPAILRVFHAMAARLVEPGPVTGNPAGSGAPTAAQRLYPSHAAKSG